MTPSAASRAEGTRLAVACPELFSDKERLIIARYTAFFLEEKPRVVHVWNADHLLAAVAAVLAGVPRVVMAARSMAPRSRFSFGFESADDVRTEKVLRRLLEFPAVRLTVNSHAGAADFADWLHISPENIPVVWN
ncbi:hypothetical protein LJC23_05875, partial [Desulfovibrio sp. OttesenSCG-928-I05]|nr:hypothetical protein [Desulfovibrio sp. OttesenSCG-928-I05]